MATSSGGAGGYLYDMLSLSAGGQGGSTEEAGQPNKDAFHAVHLRAADRASTSKMAHNERALFRAMKAPDWWVRRIRHLFGGDGLPVYLVSDSPALAVKVASALRRGKPSISAITRGMGTKGERVVQLDQPLGAASTEGGDADGGGVITDGEGIGSLSPTAAAVDGSSSATVITRPCSHVYSQLADVEMMVRAQKFAAVIGEGMTLSNLPKLVIKLRSGRQRGSSTANAGGGGGAGGAAGEHAALEALRSVYNVEQPESRAPRSMYDDCDLSSARMSNATADCHLDEVIGLNYFGAVG
jgi:hypothetical protein